MNLIEFVILIMLTFFQVMVTHEEENYEQQ